MKTPEQIAEEYAEDWHKDCDYPAEILRHTKKATETVFLAGYQAGRLNSEGVQAAKDQLADADKLIKPTEEIGRDELNCMIAHFENDDYKISVMVPGILPKEDGGELVRGCGLIVYELWKKVTK